MYSYNLKYNSFCTTVKVDEKILFFFGDETTYKWEGYIFASYPHAHCKHQSDLNANST